MKRLPILLTTILLFSFSNCFSMGLQEAKEAGAVGENLNGYLASPNTQPSAEVKALIVKINALRKTKYKEVALKVNKPLPTVEKLAGKKAIQKTHAGNVVQLPDGSWAKK